MPGPSRPGLRAPAGFRALADLVITIDPFYSSDGRVFGCIPPNDRTVPIRSRAFREWLFAAAYSAHATIPTTRAFSALLHHLEAQAANRASEFGVRLGRRVSLRSAPDSSIRSILLDLADSEGRSVEITAAGWNVDSHRDVFAFEAPGTNASLPVPQSPSTPSSDPALPADPLQFLRATLNLGPAHGPAWIRCVAWLLSALRSDAPCTILLLRGPSGCGKSVAARVLRAVLDPSPAAVAGLPSSPRQLLDLARRYRVLAFDHVSALSPRICDTLCQLTSGIGATHREPGHTEAIQVWLRRPILLTVTEDFTPAPELAARCLTVTLPAIASPRPEREFLALLEHALPYILGALCDAVSATLAAAKRPVPLHTTRHASALASALAAAPSIGCTEDQILHAFDDTAPAPPPDPIIDAIRSLLRSEPKWTGTATDLAARLSIACNPRILSIRLGRAVPVLADHGIDVDPHRGGKGIRLIRLRARISASPLPELPPQPPGNQKLTSAPKLAEVLVPSVTHVSSDLAGGLGSSQSCAPACAPRGTPPKPQPDTPEDSSP